MGFASASANQSTLARKRREIAERLRPELAEREQLLAECLADGQLAQLEQERDRAVQESFPSGAAAYVEERFEYWCIAETEQDVRTAREAAQGLEWIDAEGLQELEEKLCAFDDLRTALLDELEAALAAISSAWTARNAHELERVSQEQVDLETAANQKLRDLDPPEEEFPAFRVYRRALLAAASTRKQMLRGVRWTLGRLETKLQPMRRSNRSAIRRLENRRDAVANKRREIERAEAVIWACEQSADALEFLETQKNLVEDRVQYVGVSRNAIDASNRHLRESFHTKTVHDAIRRDIRQALHPSQVGEKGNLKPTCTCSLALSAHVTHALYWNSAVVSIYGPDGSADEAERTRRFCGDLPALQRQQAAALPLVVTKHAREAFASNGTCDKCAIGRVKADCDQRLTELLERLGLDGHLLAGEPLTRLPPALGKHLNVLTAEPPEVLARLGKLVRLLADFGDSLRRGARARGRDPESFDWSRLLAELIGHVADLHADLVVEEWADDARRDDEVAIEIIGRYPIEGETNALATIKSFAFPESHRGWRNEGWRVTATTLDELIRAESRIRCLHYIIAARTALEDLRDQPVFAGPDQQATALALNEHLAEHGPLSFSFAQEHGDRRVKQDGWSEAALHLSSFLNTWFARQGVVGFLPKASATIIPEAQAIVTEFETLFESVKEGISGDELKPATDFVEVLTRIIKRARTTSRGVHVWESGGSPTMSESEIENKLGSIEDTNRLEQVLGYVALVACLATFVIELTKEDAEWAPASTAALEAVASCEHIVARFSGGDLSIRSRFYFQLAGVAADVISIVYDLEEMGEYQQQSGLQVDLAKVRVVSSIFTATGTVIQFVALHAGAKRLAASALLRALCFVGGPVTLAIGIIIQVALLIVEVLDVFGWQEDEKADLIFRNWYDSLGKLRFDPARRQLTLHWFQPGPHDLRLRNQSDHWADETFHINDSTLEQVTFEEVTGDLYPHLPCAVGIPLSAITNKDDQDITRGDHDLYVQVGRRGTPFTKTFCSKWIRTAFNSAIKVTLSCSRGFLDVESPLKFSSDSRELELEFLRHNADGPLYHVKGDRQLKDSGCAEFRLDPVGGKVRVVSLRGNVLDTQLRFTRSLSAAQLWSVAYKGDKGISGIDQFSD